MCDHVLKDTGPPHSITLSPIVTQMMNETELQYAGYPD